MIKSLGRGLVMLLLFASLDACNRAANAPGGAAAGAGTNPKKITYATIYITTNGAGGCAAAAVPSVVQVSKQDDIEWSFVDFCGVTQGYTVDIELKAWKATDGVNCSDGSQNPLDVSLGSTKGKQKVKGGINRNCDYGKIFKYEIWTGGATPTKLADPELELSM